jgi:hypothetical protein
MGAETLFVPEARMVARLSTTIRVTDVAADAHLCWESQGVSLAETEGVLARLWGVSTEGIEPEDQSYVFAEWSAFLRGWLEIFRGPVVNRLRPEFWHRRQIPAPLIPTFAPTLSAHIPDFIVSNDGAALIDCFHRCHGNLILSPLTTMSRYLIRTPEELERALSLTQHMPLYIRESASRQLADVVVVGDEAIVTSDVANLPGELLRDCISAASTLGAFLCGFELEAASDGRPVCSAIDLMPNMARYERELQDELALRIANALLGRARAFGHQ